MAELLQDLLAWVSANPSWGHLSVFLVALGESLAIVGLIVPGAVMMLGAGALIAAGALQFWPVCLWAIAGAVAGDGLSYWLGRRYQDRLTALWPFTRYPETLAAGIGFFQKYGGKSVAFGRFVGPVRAVIPLVAGMMGMPAGRFLFANVLSAAVWAPAYLLPGVVFGASLEVAAEATFHLVLLLLALAGLMWAAAWGVKQLFLLYSPRAKGWVERLLRWAEVHPRMGEVAQALADPEHPEAGTLAVLAAILLLAVILFALEAGFAVTGADQLFLNRFASNVALGLQSPTASYLMAMLGRLGSPAVILPLVLVVSGWLLWRGDFRQASYWLAAGAFALLAGSAFELLLPSPHGGPLTPSAVTSPSLDIMGATVVYGFLAISLAGAMTPAWRWMPYAWAAALITAVVSAQLYFGRIWLTNVLAALALGSAWVAALGIAYRRHRHAQRSWRPLARTALIALVVAFGLASLFLQSPDLSRNRPTQPAITITQSEWQSRLWSSLPQARDDLRRAYRHPLDLQYAGPLSELQARLAPLGWEAGPPLSWKMAIKLFSPSQPLSHLPVIPQVHDGHYESLALVKPLNSDSRLVLRLWRTTYLIDGEKPLWIGNITTQHKQIILGLLAVPLTDPSTKDAAQPVQGDLSALHPFRPSGSAPLLLQ